MIENRIEERRKEVRLDLFNQLYVEQIVTELETLESVMAEINDMDEGVVTDEPILFWHQTGVVSNPINNDLTPIGELTTTDGDIYGYPQYYGVTDFTTQVKNYPEGAHLAFEDQPMAHYTHDFAFHVRPDRTLDNRYTNLLGIQDTGRQQELIEVVYRHYEKIPQDWQLKTLSEIGKIVGGGTPDTTQSRYWDGDIAWAVPTDITNLKERFIERTERNISEEGFQNSSAKLLPIGTILITSRATIGECVITKIPITTNQGFQSLICNFENSNGFIYYALKFHKNKLLSLAHGSTFLEVSGSNIKKVILPCPPLKEQQKIASILSKVDELIQKTDQVIEQTQRLKKGLMQRLLTKGIGHLKFKNVYLGLRFLTLSVPKSWRVVTMEEITQIIDTPHYTSPYFDSGIPVIRTSDCSSSGEIAYSETTFTSREEYERRRQVIDPEVGDVLYTREAPPGIAVYVDRTEIIVGQRIILMKPKKEIIKGEFLVSFLNSRFGMLQSNAMTLKTTVEHVNIEDIRKFKVAVPPIQEQKLISERIQNFSKIIDLLKKYRVSLSDLKRGLMQKLLTGEIRVKV